MPPSTDSGDPKPEASRLERALLPLALAFYAVAVPWCTLLSRPGWSAYDEESLLDQVQACREGHGLVAGFAAGTLHRGLAVLLCAMAGPHLALIHAIALAAVEVEALLLYAWLRGPLGERAAIWAGLADLVCTATFARGACLLCVSVLPAAFLAGALACERLRRPWQALLWGLAAGLMLLDYEGWAGALLFLLPYAAWRWRRRPGLCLAAGLGFLAALSVVWGLSPSLAGHLAERRHVSSSSQGRLTQIILNLRGLLFGGDRLAFSAAAGQPWPAPWIWLPVALGAVRAWKRKPWLAWLLLCGALPLGLAGTSLEPHRLSLMLLALAACAGAGADLLCRRRWGAVVCLALLALGVADETLAWADVPPSKLEASYGASWSLEEAGLWLAHNAPPEGWRAISGLGYRDDGAFRLFVAGQGLPPQGRDPVAVVPWEYLPGLRTLRPGFKTIAFGIAQPMTLVLLPPGDAARLERVSAELAPLHWAVISNNTGAQSAAAMAWLKAPGHGDPWARTVAWELWLHASLQDRQLDLASCETLLNEPLVCGWAPDVIAKELSRTRPALAARFRAKAEAVDPRRLNMGQAERTARY